MEWRQKAKGTGKQEMAAAFGSARDGDDVAKCPTNNRPSRGCLLTAFLLQIGRNKNVNE